MCIRFIIHILTYCVADIRQFSARVAVQQFLRPRFRWHAAQQWLETLHWLQDVRTTPLPPLSTVSALYRHPGPPLLFHRLVRRTRQSATLHSFLYRLCRRHCVRCTSRIPVRFFISQWQRLCLSCASTCRYSVDLRLAVRLISSLCRLFLHLCHVLSGFSSGCHLADVSGPSWPDVARIQ